MATCRFRDKDEQKETKATKVPISIMLEPLFPSLPLVKIFKMPSTTL
jgi:hypothetical protein